MRRKISHPSSLWIRVYKRHALDLYCGVEISFRSDIRVFAKRDGAKSKALRPVIPSKVHTLVLIWVTTMKVPFIVSPRCILM